MNVVLGCIENDTVLVIGHSLGPVIAYEALCCESKNVIGFISLGSPLGIRNLIFDKLKPRPNSMGVGSWPGRIRHWTNIADRGDIVALEKRLGPFFGGPVLDVLVYNGANAHHGERYLTAQETGEAAHVCPWGKDF